MCLCSKVAYMDLFLILGGYAVAQTTWRTVFWMSVSHSSLAKLDGRCTDCIFLTIVGSVGWKNKVTDLSTHLNIDTLNAGDQVCVCHRVGPYMHP